jgi:calcium channel MID1
VIFDLPFCSDIAYAVPSSRLFQTNTTALVEKYDSLAAEYYKNFTNSLEQVACDTTGTAQYSLARTCEDCRVDYKTWLCSVLMPRCEDFSATDPWLQPRNIRVPFANGSLAFSSNTSTEFNSTIRDRFAFSQSRNPMIDTVIKPGPYKELLPCEDLCFDIVKSCPAVLGFSCPNEPARKLTYGKKTEGALTCNFPGAVVDLNVARSGAAGRLTEVVLVVVVAVVVGLVFSL